MRRCEVSDDADTGKITLSFTFDGHDARELAEVGALVQAARAFARDNGRLAIELEAHAAYFAVLEQGTRGLPTVGFRPASQSEGDPR